MSWCKALRTERATSLRIIRFEMVNAGTPTAWSVPSAVGCVGFSVDEVGPDPLVWRGVAVIEGLAGGVAGDALPKSEANEFESLDPALDVDVGAGRGRGGNGGLMGLETE